MNHGTTKEEPVRLLFEMTREDNPRLYDDLIRFNKGTKRVNRLRFLAHEGLLAQSWTLMPAVTAAHPVVALPVYLEQLLTGKKLQELGLGTLVEKIDSVSHLQALLEQRLADTACRKKVEAFAQRCQPLREKPLDALIADRCAAILSD